MKFRAYVRIRPDGVEEGVRSDPVGDPQRKPHGAVPWDLPTGEDELYEEVMALARAPLPPEELAA